MAGLPARIALLAGLCGLCGCVPGPPNAPPPIAPPPIAPPPAAFQAPNPVAAAEQPAATPAPQDAGSALAAQGFDASPTGAAGGALRVEVPDGVLFDTASDQPHAEAADILKRLAAAQAASGAALTVLGHTDAVGSDAYNLALSARRARAVIAILVADGVPPQALSAVAIGRRQPLASNASAVGRARNRRVEFLLGNGLAANLDAVRAFGSGDVAVLHPDPAGGPTLVEADRITLPEPLALHQAQPDAQAPIRLRRPDPISRAPLTDTPSF